MVDLDDLLDHLEEADNQDNIAAASSLQSSSAGAATDSNHPHHDNHNGSDADCPANHVSMSCDALSDPIVNPALNPTTKTGNGSVIHMSGLRNVPLNLDGKDSKFYSSNRPKFSFESPGPTSDRPAVREDRRTNDIRFPDATDFNSNHDHNPLNSSVNQVNGDKDDDRHEELSLSKPSPGLEPHDLDTSAAISLPSSSSSCDKPVSSLRNLCKNMLDQPNEPQLVASDTKPPSGHSEESLSPEVDQKKMESVRNEIMKLFDDEKSFLIPNEMIKQKILEDIISGNNFMISDDVKDQVTQDQMEVQKDSSSEDGEKMTVQQFLLSSVNEPLTDEEETVLPILEDSMATCQATPAPVSEPSNSCSNLPPQKPPRTFVSQEPDPEASSSLEKPIRPSSLAIPKDTNGPIYDLGPVEDDEVICGTCDVSPPVESTALLSDISTPLQVSSTSDDVVRVGIYKPFWIPDSEAIFCMQCAVKFSMIRRKHHCRGCGKVLCAECSGFKAKLAYMDYQQARVCAICYRLLTTDSRLGAVGGQLEIGPEGNIRSPIDAMEAVAAFVPVGVLKKPTVGSERTEPKKSVVFSDGIRPGIDLDDPEMIHDGLNDAAEATCQPDGNQNSSPNKLAPLNIAKAKGASSCPKRLKSPPVESSPSGVKKHHRRHRLMIEDVFGPLPHVICADEKLTAEPSIETLMTQLKDGTTITFYLMRNLHVSLRLVKLDCCTKDSMEAWSFCSKGLAAVGQDEILVILQKIEEDEFCLPRDVFRLISNVYDSAARGSVYSDMSHVLFPEGLFNSNEYNGFLFIRGTLQCLSKVEVPPAPFLIGLLIQRNEVPWAKVFPLRLLLRLGAEYNCLYHVFYVSKCSNDHF